MKSLGPKVLERVGGELGVETHPRKTHLRPLCKEFGDHCEGFRVQLAAQSCHNRVRTISTDGEGSRTEPCLDGSRVGAHFTVEHPSVKVRSILAKSAQCLGRRSSLGP